MVSGYRTQATLTSACWLASTLDQALDQVYRAATTAAKKRGIMGQGCCDGRVAVVTGASRGIGRAIALRLASEGAAVACLSRGTTEQLGRTLQGVAAEIDATGGRAMAVPADLGDRTLDRRAVIDRVRGGARPRRHPVNNAAHIQFKDHVS